jgi:DNA polymerase-3 subunit gamma/tau
MTGGAHTAPVPETGLMAYARFEDIIALLHGARDIKLLEEVETFVQLVRYKPGMIEFNPAPGAPAELAGRLSQRLRDLTGARWSVLIGNEDGQPTIAQQAADARQAEVLRAAEHPLVLAALEAFPGAEIRAVRPLGGGAALPEEYLAPAPEHEFVEIEGDLVDSGDPFEEDY